MALDVPITPVSTRPSSLTQRIAVFAVSVAMVGLGVALMVEGGLGVSPNDVTNTGISEQTSLSVGGAAWLLAGVCTLAAWILGRRATFSTLLASLGVGAGIDVALDILPTPDAMVGRAAFMVLGLVVLWIAITGIVASDIGIGPVELVMLALTDRGMKLHVARWSIELVLLGVGFALGGSVGIGTAAFALGTGPVLAVTIPWGTRLLRTQVQRPTEVAACGP